MDENSAPVAVTHNQAAHRFEAQADGHRAHLQYRLSGESIVFIHTGVPPPIENRGIGSSLVQAGLDYARAQRLTVVPQCPFVEAYMRRHRCELDLLESSSRKPY
jgi:predicted GNAT family acetyltransferase